MSKLQNAAVVSLATMPSPTRQACHIMVPLSKLSRISAVYLS